MHTSASACSRASAPPPCSRASLGAGAPSRTTFEWVNPEGTPLPEGGPEGASTGQAAEGNARGIERAPIPEDYREHVRTYFGGGQR